MYLLVYLSKNFNFSYILLNVKMNTCHFWWKAQSKTICILFSVGSQYYSWQSTGIDNWRQSAKDGSVSHNPRSFRSRRLLLGMQAVPKNCAGWVYVSIYKVWLFIWVKWGILKNNTRMLIYIFSSPLICWYTLFSCPPVKKQLWELVSVLVTFVCVTLFLTYVPHCSEENQTIPWCCNCLLTDPLFENSLCCKPKFCEHCGKFS